MASCCVIGVPLSAHCFFGKTFLKSKKLEFSQWRHVASWGVPLNALCFFGKTFLKSKKLEFSQSKDTLILYQFHFYYEFSSLDIVLGLTAVPMSLKWLEKEFTARIHKKLLQQPSSQNV